MDSVDGVHHWLSFMNALLQDANHSLCLSDLSLISTDSELRENINNVSVRQLYKCFFLFCFLVSLKASAVTDFSQHLIYQSPV